MQLIYTHCPRILHADYIHFYARVGAAIPLTGTAYDTILIIIIILSAQSLQGLSLSTSCHDQ